MLMSVQNQQTINSSTMPKNGAKLDLVFESREIIRKFEVFSDKKGWIYVYDAQKGIWEKDIKIIKPRLQHFISKRLGYKISNYSLLEIINKVSMMKYEYMEFPDALNKVAMGNLTYNFNTGLTEPHSKDNYLISSIDVNYNSNASCPIFDKYISEVVDPKQVHTIFEMIGYSLYPNNKYEKAFMLIGEGMNGKSVLLDVIKAMFGRDNTSGLVLQNIQTSRFSAGSLRNKWVNISADISAKAITDGTGIIKSVISGDYINGELKGVDNFTFVPRAKLISSCNEIPMTTDKSFAWFRRWVIIPFPNDFSKNPHPKDTFTASMSTKSELEGILYKSLEAFKELEKRGRFELIVDKAQMESDYVSHSDPASHFLRTMVTSSHGKFLPTKKLYSEYVKFCNDRSKTPKSATAFNKMVIIEHPHTEKRRKSINKQQIPVWIDLSVKIIMDIDEMEEEQ